MKHHKSSIVIFTLFVLFLLVTWFTPWALAAEGLDINWWTSDGGGSVSLSNGPYKLHGTIGQADAGALQNGSLALFGGFWGASLLGKYSVYAPLIIK